VPEVGRELLCGRQLGTLFGSDAGNNLSKSYSERL